jgi:hypothetical protein
MELLICSPILIDKWVIEFIDDMVLLRELLSRGKASHTIVSVLGQNFCTFCDVPPAFVALNLVGRAEDVLSGGWGT